MGLKIRFVKIATILLLVVVALASIAATNQAPQVTSSGSPTDDIYVTDVGYNGGALLTRWTTPPGSTPSASSYVLLKFNLSQLTSGWPATDQIGNAQLSLYALPVLCGSGDGATESVALYGMPSAFAWSESSMPTGAQVAAQSATSLMLDADQGLVSSAVPGYYTWTNAATFAAWLQGQRANGTVTLMLKVRDSAQTDADIYYEDNELAGKNAECGITTNNPPKLTLTSVPSTAVTMSTFQAAGPAINWPLIVGLGVLALVLIVGLAVSRRRAAAR